jgi:hypothetical protein
MIVILTDIDHYLAVANLGKDWQWVHKFNMERFNFIYYYYCYYFYFYYLNSNGFLPGGNTQRTYITQNNTPHSNKTQHTKLHKQQKTHYTKWIQLQLQQKQLQLQ